MNRSAALVRCALLAALSSVGAGARAQQLEEVVVTAQKREQSVDDVPIAISAYGGALVADLGVRSAEDMTKLTPGLEVSNSGGTGTKVWTIRGVGFSDYSTGASSTVGLYVDEVAVPYPVMSTGAFFDVERIEVVKGPQGDLYGRNTTAGQINVLSRRPTREFEAGVKLGYARYETFDVEGFLSGPLGERVRARLAFTTTQSGEGWQESLSRPGDMLGEIDRTAVRGLVDFDIGDTVTALLKMYYNQDKSDNVAPTAFDGTIVGRPFPTERGAPFNSNGQLEQFVTFSTGDNTAADWTNGPNDALRPRRDNELKGAALRFSWELDEVELVSVTGYDEFDRAEANDWDGIALLDSSNINVTNIESFSQEVRLSGKSERLNWVTGVYYSDDEMTEDYNYYFGEGRFGINQLNTNYAQQTDSIAAFGHIEYKLTDRLEGVLGLRYTRENREWTGCTYDTTPTDIPVPGLPLSVFLNNIINGAGVITPNGLLNDAFNFPNGLPAVTPLAANGCGTFNDLPGTPNAGQYGVFSRKITAEEPLWKVGLNFRPIEEVLLYGSISRGFKSGGFNGANSNTHRQLLPYEIEKLTAYEVGVKSELAQRSMQLNGSVFFYDYRDKQEREAAVTPVGNIAGVSNIPKSEIYGAEIEWSWRATQELTINAGVSLLHTEITRWNPVDDIASSYPDTVRIDAAGLELPNAPKFSGNLQVAYAIPVAAFTLTPTIDVLHRSETSGDIRPESFREAYTLTDLRLSLARADSEQWRAQVWVRNAFDRDYYVSGQSGGNLTYVRTNGMPRTWGVGFDYNF